MRDYPDSQLAQQARERVAEIADEPDDPTKRLAWLVDLFPESSERSRVARIPELKDGRLRLAEAPDTSTNRSSASLPANGTTTQ
jgi:hypothetical protein